MSSRRRYSIAKSSSCTYVRAHWKIVYEPVEKNLIVGGSRVGQRLRADKKYVYLSRLRTYKCIRRLSICYSEVMKLSLWSFESHPISYLLRTCLNVNDVVYSRARTSKLQSSAGDTNAYNGAGIIDVML